MDSKPVSNSPIKRRNKPRLLSASDTLLPNLDEFLSYENESNDDSEDGNPTNIPSIEMNDIDDFFQTLDNQPHFISNSGNILSNGKSAIKDISNSIDYSDRIISTALKIPSSMVVEKSSSIASFSHDNRENLGDIFSLEFDCTNKKSNEFTCLSDKSQDIPDVLVDCNSLPRNINIFTSYEVNNIKSKDITKEITAVADSDLIYKDVLPILENDNTKNNNLPVFDINNLQKYNPNNLPVLDITNLQKCNNKNLPTNKLSFEKVDKALALSKNRHINLPNKVSKAVVNNKDSKAVTNIRYKVKYDSNADHVPGKITLPMSKFKNIGKTYSYLRKDVNSNVDKTKTLETKKLLSSELSKRILENIKSGKIQIRTQFKRTKAEKIINKEPDIITLSSDDEESIINGKPVNNRSKSSAVKSLVQLNNIISNPINASKIKTNILPGVCNYVVRNSKSVSVRPFNVSSQTVHNNSPKSNKIVMSNGNNSRCLGVITQKIEQKNIHHRSNKIVLSNVNKSSLGKILPANISNEYLIPTKNVHPDIRSKCVESNTNGLTSHAVPPRLEIPLHKKIPSTLEPRLLHEINCVATAEQMSTSDTEANDVLDLPDDFQEMHEFMKGKTLQNINKTLAKNIP